MSSLVTTTSGEVATRALERSLGYGRLTSPRLIGREPEVRRIQDAINHALEGVPALILIDGDTGMGKTRLAQEATRLARLKELRILLTGSDGSGPGLEGLGPCLERALRAEPNLGETLDPTDRAALVQIAPEAFEGAEPAPEGLTPEADRLRLLASVAALFSAFAEQRPTLIVIEDIHRAEDASWAELVCLLGRLVNASREPDTQPLRLLVVATLNALDLPDHHQLLPGARSRRTFGANAATLPPLGREHVSDMLRAMLALDEPHAELVELTLQHTDGNPYAIEAYIQSLAAKGTLSQRDERWELAEDRLTEEVQLTSSNPTQVPERFAEAVARRMARLKRNERKLLQAAAVLGTEVSVGVIEDLAGLGEDETLDALEGVTRWGHLLDPEDGSDRFRFARPSERDALLASIEPKRLEALHARAAALLEELGTDAITLGRHYHAAHDVEQAARWLLPAALQLKARSSHREALHLLELFLEAARSCDTSPAPSQLLMARRSMATIHDQLGQYDAAERCYGVAAEQARQTELCGDEAEALVGLARVLAMTNNHERALAKATDAVSLCERAGLTTQHAQSLAVLAYVEHRRRNYVEATRHFEASNRMLEDLGDRRSLALNLKQLGSARLDLGDTGTASALFERALHLARAVGDRVLQAGSLNCAGRVHGQRTELAAALRCFGEALAIWRSMGDRRGMMIAASNLGWIALLGGDFESTDRSFKEARALAHQSGLPTDILTVNLNISQLASERGQPQLATKYAEMALELSRELKDRLYEGRCFIILGMASYYTGEFDEARIHLVRAQGFVEALGDQHSLCHIYRFLGHLEHRADLLETAVEGFRKMQSGRVAEVLDHLAAIQADDGDKPAAEAAICEAVATIHSVAAKAGALRPSYLRLRHVVRALTRALALLQRSLYPNEFRIAEGLLAEAERPHHAAIEPH